MRTEVASLFSATDASGAHNSAALDTSQVAMLSVQAAFTDSASAGTLKLQASNDQTPSTWTDIASASATVASGASCLVTLANVPYQWVRAVWTPSAGAGTVTAKCKTVGF